MDTSKLPAPPCHLLNLPAELRQQIYDHVFEEHREYCAPIHLRLDSREHVTFFVYGHQPAPNTAALLRTCRIIHAETEPILIASVVFYIQLCNVQTLTRPQKSRLRDLGELRSCRLIPQIRQAELRTFTSAEERRWLSWRPVSEAVDMAKILVELLGSAPGPELKVLTISLEAHKEEEADLWVEAMMPWISECWTAPVLEGKVSAEMKERWSDIQAKIKKRSFSGLSPYALLHVSHEDD